MSRNDILLSILLVIFFLAISPFAFAQVSIEGKFVPRTSIIFYAPDRSYRIRGWSSGGWVKAKFLYEEKKIEKGELLAEFEVEITSLMNWLGNRHESTKVKAEELQRDEKQKVEGLSVQYQKQKLYEKQLNYDLQKKGFISGQNYKLLEMDKRIALFDLRAINEQIAIERTYLKDMDEYYQKDIRMWKYYIDYMSNDYKTRFKIYAPATGYVSYTILPIFKKKAQQGQGIKGGWPYMKLSAGNDVDIEFNLPEEYYEHAKIGTPIEILHTSSKKKIHAIITSVNEFPQYLGEVEDDFNTPYAMEKAFVVRARTEETTEFLPGSEVSVFIQGVNT